jgi:hypothetical protein
MLALEFWKDSFSAFMRAFLKLGMAKPSASEKLLVLSTLSIKGFPGEASHNWFPSYKGNVGA